MTPFRSFSKSSSFTTMRMVMNSHKNGTTTPLFKRFHTTSSSSKQSTTLFTTAALTLTATTTAAALYILPENENDNTYSFLPSNNKTLCELQKRKSSDVLMLSPTKEPATGILFPQLCNGMTFVGCGVRVKYAFVKVYAVGTYVDPITMSVLKKSSPTEIQKALCDPMYPRTIRIVMNRGLSIEKFTAAIIETLEPRMKGVDLDKLEEFKKLNPPIDLIQGAEIEMTIRGDTMLYKNCVGGVGAIHSKSFCEALCDTYYGADDPVSPGHLKDVIAGIQKLK